MGIRSVRWTAKTEFLFFFGFLFTSSEFTYQYQNYYILVVSFLTKQLKILTYIDIDTYTEIVWTLSQAMAENEYAKREKNGEVRFIYKIFICLETIINKAFTQLDGK